MNLNCCCTWFLLCSYSHCVIEGDQQHFRHQRYMLFKSLHFQQQSSCRASRVRGRILKRLNQLIYYLLISMKAVATSTRSSCSHHVHCCVRWFISRISQQLLNQYPQNLAEGWNQEPNEFGAETDKGAGRFSLVSNEHFGLFHQFPSEWFPFRELVY